MVSKVWFLKLFPAESDKGARVYLRLFYLPKLLLLGIVRVEKET